MTDISPTTAPEIAAPVEPAPASPPPAPEESRTPKNVTRLEPIKYPKYVDRALALKGFPYPTLDAHGTIVALKQPLSLATTLDHDRMMGRAYRDMVVPSMLPMFEEAIRLRSLTTPRQLQMILGAPAVGKSYLAYMISRMRTEEGALIVDCAGKNLDELLFEFSLEKDGGGAGIAMRPGRLTEAYLTGREIIPDEYNKAKAGSGTALNQVLQVYTGELDSHTARRGGLEVTFNRNLFSPEHFITATGNYTEDGPSTQELAASEYSRWQPRFVPMPTDRDWSHRISQRLTGLPLTTLYDMGQSHWQKDPRTFCKLLTGLRTLGLRSDEVRNIPHWQTDMIAAWENTLPACLQLGQFMSNWYTLMNIKARGNAAKVDAALRSEIDDGYKRRIAMDMRKMIEMVFDAVDIKSPAESLDALTALVLEPSWMGEPDVRSVAAEPVLRHFGTRLQNVIEQNITDTTVPFGKEVLRKALVNAGEECGIFPVDTKTKKGGLKTIAELLDIEAPGLSILPEHRLVQKHICDYMRLSSPTVPEDDERILPIADIVGAFDRVTDLQAHQPESPAKARDLVSVALSSVALSGTPADIISLGSVVDTIKLDDINAAATGTKISLPGTVDAYMNIEDFLLSLTLPAFGARNLDTLWNRNISEILGESNTESVKMAEGTHDKLAVQVLVCATHGADGKDVLAPLTMVHSKKTGEFVVFGQPVLGPNLIEVLSDAKITYVPASLPEFDAETALNVMIDSIGERTRMKDNLNTALGLRIHEQSASLTSRLRRPAVNFRNSKPIVLLNGFRSI